MVFGFNTRTFLCRSDLFVYEDGRRLSSEDIIHHFLSHLAGHLSFNIVHLFLDGLDLLLTFSDGSSARIKHWSRGSVGLDRLSNNSRSDFGLIP